MLSLMCKILQKYREKGISGVVKAVQGKIARYSNVFILYYFQKRYPIQDNLIILESEGDLSDNSYALFDYMMHNGYLKKYHVIWAVADVDQAAKQNFPNTEYLPKIPYTINWRWAKAFATCKWFIYDHWAIMAGFYKRKGQKIVYLSHGVGFKAPTSSGLIKSHYDVMTVPGPLAAKIMSEYWQEPIDHTIITGYPRLDYFYQDNTAIKNEIYKKWHFERYSKIIYWMPTFRQSFHKELSEEYLQNETGLPLFETKHDLQEISDFLQENNMLLVFKLHHLQADLPIFKTQFANILLLKDEELQKMGIQLYQFIPLAEVLITDYSSIYTDYLLLNRPVIFTLDDYEEYDKSRGLLPQNAIDYMKGYHVYSKEELMNSLLEIKSGYDKYQKDRAEIIDYYHKYKDGNSSKRVLQMVGIKK